MLVGFILPIVATSTTHLLRSSQCLNTISCCGCILDPLSVEACAFGGHQINTFTPTTGLCAVVLRLPTAESVFRSPATTMSHSTALLKPPVARPNPTRRLPRQRLTTALLPAINTSVSKLVSRLKKHDDEDTVFNSDRLGRRSALVEPT